jgi:hypothetical protein
MKIEKKSAGGRWGCRSANSFPRPPLLPPSFAQIRPRHTGREWETVGGGGGGGGGGRVPHLMHVAKAKARINGAVPRQTSIIVPRFRAPRKRKPPRLVFRPGCRSLTLDCLARSLNPALTCIRGEASHPLRRPPSAGIARLSPALFLVRARARPLALHPLGAPARFCVPSPARPRSFGWHLISAIFARGSGSLRPALCHRVTAVGASTVFSLFQRLAQLPFLDLCVRWAAGAELKKSSSSSTFSSSITSSATVALPISGFTHFSLFLARRKLMRLFSSTGYVKLAKVRRLTLEINCGSVSLTL